MSDTHSRGGSYVIGEDGQRSRVELPSLPEEPSDQAAIAEADAVVPPESSDDPDKSVAKKRKE